MWAESNGPFFGPYQVSLRGGIDKPGPALLRLCNHDGSSGIAVNCRSLGGGVMTRDWVHGVGHSPVRQILLQILSRALTMASPPC